MRQASASGWSTSSRSVLSDCTISGPADTSGHLQQRLARDTPVSHAVPTRYWTVALVTGSGSPGGEPRRKSRKLGEATEKPGSDPPPPSSSVLVRGIGTGKFAGGEESGKIKQPDAP